MFERYTEQARRAIFFARYETSQFGAEQIEPDHFLLGLFRQDPVLMKRFLPDTSGESIRDRIQREAPLRQGISTSTDLPLSHSVKRILAYGAEEAERMGHLHIGTEHLLLGLLREPTSASRILESLGVTIEGARQEIAKSGVTADPIPVTPLTPEEAAAERDALRSMIESLPDDALRADTRCAGTRANGSRPRHAGTDRVRRHSAADPRAEGSDGYCGWLAGRTVFLDQHGERDHGFRNAPDS